jgi:hypothetical protein
MQIKGFVWLEDIVEKLWWKHQVTQQEVLEVFANRPKIHFVEKGHYPGDDMTVNKSSTSKATSYQEIGDYWDEHDVSEIWEQTEPIEFEIDIQSEVRYVALEPRLAADIQQLAEQKGVTSQTLVNLWLREKFEAEAPAIASAA